MSQDIGEPVDRVAARVAGRGERWEFKPDPFVESMRGRVQECLANPLRLPLELRDERGKRFGRMTVACFGFTRDRTPAGNRGRGCIRYWVCRCDCGEHEMRTQKAVNAGNPTDRCHRCRQMASERSHQAFHESRPTAEHRQPEFISRAAIRREGKVYVGRRHDEIINREAGAQGIRPFSGEQGFETSTGRFVDRFEALSIAQAAGQIKPGTQIRAGRLFSQDVW